MCSKCFNEKQVREKKTNNPIPVPCSSINEASRSQEVKTELVSNDIKVSFAVQSVAECPPVTTPTTAPKKKTKKKKNSYRSMMAGIVETNASDRNIEKEKDGIRKVTGGGAFSKIDKI